MYRKFKVARPENTRKQITIGIHKKTAPHTSCGEAKRRYAAVTASAALCAIVNHEE
jgi:hypothetical protein